MDRHFDAWETGGTVRLSAGHEDRVCSTLLVSAPYSGGPLRQAEVWESDMLQSRPPVLVHADVIVAALGVSLRSVRRYCTAVGRDERGRLLYVLVDAVEDVRHVKPRPGP